MYKPFWSVFFFHFRICLQFSLAHVNWGSSCIYVFLLVTKSKWLPSAAPEVIHEAAPPCVQPQPHLLHLSSVDPPSLPISSLVSLLSLIPNGTPSLCSTQQHALPGVHRLQFSPNLFLRFFLGCTTELNHVHPTFAGVYKLPGSTCSGLCPIWK